MDRNVLGGDLSSLIVGDEEGDVCGALIELEEAGDGRRTVACLYPDRVHLPRVVEPNRAFFCISHTSSISSASSSAMSTRTHPLPLRLGQYSCSIWLVFFVAVVVAEGVPDDRSEALLLGLVQVLNDIADNVLALRRRDKDWVMFVVVTVFCGTPVGAKQVGYITFGCDTDWG